MYFFLIFFASTARNNILHLNPLCSCRVFIAHLIKFSRSLLFTLLFFFYIVSDILPRILFLFEKFMDFWVNGATRTANRYNVGFWEHLSDWRLHGESGPRLVESVIQLYNDSDRKALKYLHWRFERIFLLIFIILYG